MERRLIHWTRELRDGGAVLLKKGGARAGHMMAQKLHLADSKNKLDGEAMIFAELKDLVQMILMGNQIRRIDENII